MSVDHGTGRAAGPTVDVVVPTIGRPSLGRLLAALAADPGPRPGRIVLVDDRRDRSAPLLPGGAPAALAGELQVVAGRAAGPASARQLGWRAGTAPWVSFLDDDVEPQPGWLGALHRDLLAAGPEVGGVQGRIEVPGPDGRRPTDWERQVQGLATARWPTADMAYRRAALVGCGGFDERFPRAYREDADLALRVADDGWRLVVGERRVRHPVGPADRWVSVRLQRGNLDDALMRRLHGPSWRARSAAGPAGRRRRHVAVTAAGMVALLAAAARRPRLAGVAGATWAAGTAELAWARIAPGPRTPDEITTMVLTSAAIPPVATAWWLLGLRRAARLAGAPGPVGGRPDAVLFDRDGTLVVDVPYNGDPRRVRPVDGAGEAVAELRRHGIRVGVVTNQSGVARGLLDEAQVSAVNRRVDQLLGPFDAWAVCAHGPEDGCGCRKPAPGLIHRAARQVGVEPSRCVVVGDIGSDVLAARAAGARGILVPTPVTRPEEVAAAPEVAPDLRSAVARILGVHG